MNILHFSDTHGKLPQIPKKWRNGDTVIVLSGDICDNYPEETFTPGYMYNGNFTSSNWHMWNFRLINTVLEKELQEGWIQTKLIPHLNDNKINFDNVIILKGNHDFCSFEKFFNNALDLGAKTITVQGVKFGLLTGVTKYVGEWNDEVDDSVIGERIKQIDKDIHILVSHAPPYGIRDMGYGNRIGSNEIVKAIFGHYDKAIYFTNIRYHLFGHAHGQHGVDKKEVSAVTGTRIVKFVNAAQNRMNIDIDPEKW